MASSAGLIDSAPEIAADLGHQLLERRQGGADQAGQHLLAFGRELVDLGGHALDLALDLVEAGHRRVGRGLVGDPAQRGADLVQHALELGAEVDAADDQGGRLVRRVAGRLDGGTGGLLSLRPPPAWPRPLPASRPARPAASPAGRPAGPLPGWPCPGTCGSRRTRPPRARPSRSRCASRIPLLCARSVALVAPRGPGRKDNPRAIMDANARARGVSWGVLSGDWERQDMRYVLDGIGPEAEKRTILDRAHRGADRQGAAGGRRLGLVGCGAARRQRADRGGARQQHPGRHGLPHRPGHASADRRRTSRSGTWRCCTAASSARAA